MTYFTKYNKNIETFLKISAMCVALSYEMSCCRCKGIFFIKMTFCFAISADCYWMLDALLEFSIHGSVPPVIEERKSFHSPLDAVSDLPERMEGD